MTRLLDWVSKRMLLPILALAFVAGDIGAQGSQAVTVETASRIVGAEERADGSVVVFRGDLEVFGRVEGSAIALMGDVTVHPGGFVGGNVISVNGVAAAPAGAVGGQVRAFSGTVAVRDVRPPFTRGDGLALAAAWFAILAVIGAAVLAFGRGHLETVAETIRENFSRAFLIGLLGQAALIPGMVALVILLAITVVGILLIPFALVAYLLAAMGALAVGFLAMSFVTGESVMTRRGEVSARAPGAWRYMMAGLAMYFVLWALAGGLQNVAVLAGLARLGAVAITWAALTVGFGATLLSRAGTRTRAGAAEPEPEPEEEYSWMTPTPVTGVAAVKRPVGSGAPLS